MTSRVAAVVLDAANIACDNLKTPKVWQFARVEQVREACEVHWPGARVLAKIDASVEGRLSDRRLLRDALSLGWLETAPGDADDLVLELADRTGAPVISRDNFVNARNTYRWLEEEPDRVWSFSWQRGEVVLTPRPLPRASDEQIAKAQREKARKAGIISMADDERWLCLGSREKCNRSGQPTQIRELQGRRTCLFCGFDVEEQVHARQPEAPPGPPSLLLMVDGRERARLDLPPDGLLLGRGGPSLPEVTDVTSWVDADAASFISRRQLHVDLDDEGWPIVVHQGELTVTCLNPHFDPRGQPENNRLVRGARYPLCEGDELVLDTGRIRLIVSCGEPR